MQKLQERYKTLIAVLGSALTYLYAIQGTNPNKYVAGAILVLTVLGVHQIPNAKTPTPTAPSVPSVTADTDATTSRG